MLASSLYSYYIQLLNLIVFYHFSAFSFQESCYTALFRGYSGSKNSKTRSYEYRLLQLNKFCTRAPNLTKRIWLEARSEKEAKFTRIVWWWIEWLFIKPSTCGSTRGQPGAVFQALGNSKLITFICFWSAWWDLQFELLTGASEVNGDYWAAPQTLHRRK